MTEGDFPKRIGIPLDVQQIEAKQEDPRIKQRFQEELKKSGLAEVDPHHNFDESDHPGLSALNHSHSHAHDHSHRIRTDRATRTAIRRIARRIKKRGESAGGRMSSPSRLTLACSKCAALGYRSGLPLRDAASHRSAWRQGSSRRRRNRFCALQHDVLCGTSFP